VSLLDLRDLNIYFRSAEKPVKVVSSLNFHIKESEIFGLAGESGCGKSITALSIMGILPPNAIADGEIFFRGKDLLKLDREKMRQLRGREISMIFQEPMTSLNPVLTIGYQIAEVLTTHLKCQENRNRSIELLRMVRIPSLKSGEGISASDVGRDAAARDDRDGDRLQPRTAYRRRTDNSP
jgi:ABC-type dipeptide/oligopeptide/nickel transport system ATPase component